MKIDKIFFNQPSIIDREIDYIRNIKNFSSEGFYSKRCSQWLKRNIKCKEALLVKSCTAALEMAAILINVKPKDEIIMPSFTFTSTANAFVLRGAKPIFVDIDPETQNLDPKAINKVITKKTKAIVVVHYAGVSCDMNLITKIAKRENLYVIEDAAQAILSSYKNKPLGSIGDLGALSFHETKNIHCGEGGALLINNPKFIKRAKIIRDKGTNRDLFNRNIVKKYTWVDYGSSYQLSELNAAFLYGQLRQAKNVIRYRLKIFKLYRKFFENLEKKKFIKIPKIPYYSKPNGHIFYILLKKKKLTNLLNFLNSKKIYATFHYTPLHNSFFGKNFIKKKYN